VRNKALHDRLLVFAQAAAEHLSERVESGLEVPFEVAQSPGATSVLYRYRPLSGQFVRQHFAELRASEGFAPVILELTKVDGLSAYLRILGVNYAPVGERDRAETVLREFTARLWEEATVFEFDEQRFERGYAELESSLYENSVVATVLAPLPGVQIADERWELGSGLALVRGDLCDAPPEAVWEPGLEQRSPNTLVVLNVEAAPQEPPPLTAARVAFRKLLTTLRLFKRGGAALGATAWWRLDDGPWQSLPLGFSGRPGGGDYWLEPVERDELTELFDVARARSLSGGPLPWALSRFEMGCGQLFALDGLSDHLLALSALLEGEETSPAGISSRLAALCAEPANRGKLEQRIEQAFALQRLLMRGELDGGYVDAIGADAPDVVASDLEEHLRAILRDMVCGYLDTDVKRIADDLLRAESGRRPAPAEVSETPLFGSTSKRVRKKEPVLDSWEEVAPEPVPEEETADPPEPQFVVRRRKKTPSSEKPARRASKTSRSAARPSARAASEQETQETAVVGSVREIGGEEDALDWGFDDDPADYSAAV
jgi:hypothetical protein